LLPIGKKAGLFDTLFYDRGADQQVIDDVYCQALLVTFA